MKPHSIFGEAFEQSALDQFYSALEQDFVVRAALMPDAHQGYSLPIGAVVATKDYVLPSWVGYDIGCGMCAMPTTFSAAAVRERAKEIHHSILRAVPTGFNTHVKPLDAPPKWRANGWPCPTDTGMNIFNARGGLRQLGTLGGGNHFIEVGADEDDIVCIVWIIIHSGSRGPGHGIATNYMKLASGDGKAREGHFGFRTDSDLGREYLMDAEFALEFALENRLAMMHSIERAIHYALRAGEGLFGKLINRNHNHVDWRTPPIELGSLRPMETDAGLLIHRKGATHAEYGMMGVIPGNMRDGSFIVRGKGNPDALWSSSHGAGRVLGRKVAKKTLRVEDFEAQMEGIVAQVGEKTLDESPMAYKNIFEVMKAQRDLVEVVTYVKPILNVKG